MFRSAPPPFNFKSEPRADSGVYCNLYALHDELEDTLLKASYFIKKRGRHDNQSDGTFVETFFICSKSTFQRLRQYIKNEILVNIPYLHDTVQYICGTQTLPVPLPAPAAHKLPRPHIVDQIVLDLHTVRYQSGTCCGALCKAVQ